MSNLFSVVVILLVGTLYSIAAQKYIPSPVNKYCRRKISAPIFSSSNTAVEFRTDINCASNTGLQRSGVLVHDFYSSPLPSFRIRAWKRATDYTNGAGFFFGSRFLVDRVYEYNETNGIPGFQIGSDTLIKTYSLRDTARTNKWSTLSVNPVSVTGNITVQEITTSLVQNDVAAMSFGVKLTTDEVTDTSNNVTKIVLDTVSFKSLLTLQNITYASSDPNVRLCIGGILISVGGTYNKTALETPASDGERPDENTNNQSCRGVYSNDNSTTAGFFSFQRKVYAKGPTGVQFVANLLLSDLAVTSDTDATLLGDEAGSVRRIFLSLFEQKVSSFVWDPSVGVIEPPQNNVGGASFTTNAPTPLTSSAPSMRSTILFALMPFVLAVVSLL